MDNEMYQYFSNENGILKTIDVNKKSIKNFMLQDTMLAAKKNIFSRLINLKNYLPNITANN